MRKFLLIAAIAAALAVAYYHQTKTQEPIKSTQWTPVSAL